VDSPNCLASSFITDGFGVFCGVVDVALGRAANAHVLPGIDNNEAFSVKGGREGVEPV
jgi:hypothetical protein